MPCYALTAAVQDYAPAVRGTFNGVLPMGCLEADPGLEVSWRSIARAAKTYPPSRHGTAPRDHRLWTMVEVSPHPVL